MDEAVLFKVQSIDFEKDKKSNGQKQETPRDST